MSYRYIGNKTRVAATILGAIEGYVTPGATIADPMCGTAAVSAALRQSGFRVVASDLMTFAVQHARVRLLLAVAPAFGGIGCSYGEAVGQLNRLKPVQGALPPRVRPGRTAAGGMPAAQVPDVAKRRARRRDPGAAVTLAARPQRARERAPAP